MSCDQLCSTSHILTTFGLFHNLYFQATLVHYKSSFPYHTCVGMHCNMSHAFGRSMLRSGDHTLHLWEVKRETPDSKKRRRASSVVFSTPMFEKEEETFSTILSGPAADNPSVSAVRVIINFGKQDKPVYYPSVANDSRNILFK